MGRARRKKLPIIAIIDNENYAKVKKKKRAQKKFRIKCCWWKGENAQWFFFFVLWRRHYTRTHTRICIHWHMYANRLINHTQITLIFISVFSLRLCLFLQVKILFKCKSNAIDHYYLSTRFLFFFPFLSLPCVAFFWPFLVCFFN